MQGIHTMKAEVYHQDPAPTPSLSNSLIKTLLTRSPKHAWMQHPKLNPAWKPYEAEKFDLGTAAHAMLLEGVDKVDVLGFDDWRTKDAKTLRDLSRANGRIPMLRHQYEEAKEMVDVAREFVSRNDFLAEMFSSGKPEQAMFWRDSSSVLGTIINVASTVHYPLEYNAGGIWCRGLIDYHYQASFIDYKTTSTTSPQEFMRSSMVAFGYDTQHAFYRRGLRHCGYTDPKGLFFVQEDTAPFACYLVEPSESMAEMAEHKIERAIKMWADALCLDLWPTYAPPGGVYHAQAPAWAITQEYSNE